MREIQRQEVIDLIDMIAREWDGCEYDTPGEAIDIGEAMRTAGFRRVHALFDAAAPGRGTQGLDPGALQPAGSAHAAVSGWLNPETGKTCSAAEKESMEQHQGLPGARIAESFSVPLVRSTGSRPDGAAAALGGTRRTSMPETPKPSVRFAEEFASRLFAGRKGHGGTPVSYMQLTRQDVANIIAAGYEAGAERGSSRQSDSVHEGHVEHEGAAARQALQAAAAAIYFADSSDYLPALRTVVRRLSPELAELLERNPRAAFDTEMNLVEPLRGALSVATEPPADSRTAERPHRG